MTFVEVVSLSVIVSVADSTSSPFVVVPLTVSVSLPSSVLSSVGVRSNVALPLVASAGIVSVKPVTVSKSVPPTAVPFSTDTLTDVGLLLAASSSVPVTVTIRWPAPSDTESGFSDSVTFDDSVSSSAIVSDVESTGSSLLVPLTVTVSSPSWTLSSVGVRLNVAVALLVLAGMVSVKLLTVPKSVPAVAVPLATDTLTDVALVSTPTSSVALTVIGVEPSPSSTVPGFTDRMIFSGLPHAQTSRHSDGGSSQ